jgi:hypothetical protein
MPFTQKSLSDLVMDVVGCTQDRISGAYLKKSGNSVDIISTEDALPIDDDFILKAKSPSQHTLLHKYIENYLSAEYFYGHRKDEEQYPQIVYDLLDTYQLTYGKINYTGRDSNYELYKAATPAFRLLAHDAFSILFQNRELMRDFSRLVATVNTQSFPRADYWPTWLREAIFYRDHGRCGICSCDLTGTIAIDRKVHIDHMIPISLRGTNDPTNLQILCDTCNLRKGNKNDDTSVLHIPWHLPPHNLK